MPPPPLRFTPGDEGARGVRDICQRGDGPGAGQCGTRVMGRVCHYDDVAVARGRLTHRDTSATHCRGRVCGGGTKRKRWRHGNSLEHCFETHSTKKCWWMGLRFWQCSVFCDLKSNKDAFVRNAFTLRFEGRDDDHNYNGRRSRRDDRGVYQLAPSEATPPQTDISRFTARVTGPETRQTLTGRLLRRDTVFLLVTSQAPPHSVLSFFLSFLCIHSRRRAHSRDQDDRRRRDVFGTSTSIPLHLPSPPPSPLPASTYPRSSSAAASSSSSSSSSRCAHWPQ